MDVGMKVLEFWRVLVDFFDWTDNRPLLAPDFVEDGLLFDNCSLWYRLLLIIIGSARVEVLFSSKTPNSTSST